MMTLKEILPGVARVAVLWNPDRPDRTQWQAAQDAAAALGLQIHSLGVDGSFEQLEAAFAKAAAHGDQAVLVLDDKRLWPQTPTITRLATAARLPVIHSDSWFVRRPNNGFMGYGPSHEHLKDLLAGFIHRIFQGARPQDLPVEQPTQIQLSINLTTAKALNLTIPQSVLIRADEIIE